MNEFAIHLTRAGAPAPSVEAVLHSLLPHTFVDHTHADAVLAVTNTADGERRIADIYGNQVVIFRSTSSAWCIARSSSR